MLNQIIMNKINDTKENRKIIRKRITGYSIKYLFIPFILQVILCPVIFSQTISVSGKITSNRFPVRFASVKFIADLDTTIQFSATTDDMGDYTIGVTSISSNDNNLPAKFELGQSFPNPFSSSANIPYGLNKTSNVQVTIYDILGRVVRKFETGIKSPGIHNIAWDGRNNFGQSIASGIYLYSMNVDGESQVKKMVYNQTGSNSIVLNHSFSFKDKQTLSKSNSFNNLNGETYTVRIQNTNATMPIVVPQEIENVVIKNDTTINFFVSHIPSATIDFDEQHQIIRGFGAASPWYLSVMTDSEVQSAFGMDEGEIGFSIFRITLEPDPTRWARYLPSAKKAYEMGAIIIAAPWYVPSDMIVRVDNKNKIRQDKYDDFVEHLNSFVKFMSDNGAPVYGVSIQNEPDISEDWTWWDPEDMVKFMAEYAHLIEGTLVMAPESFQFRREMSDPILNDSAATANTDIICGHIYGGGLYSYPLAEEKGKEVWMTEYLMGENNSGNNMEWAIALAENINDVMEANMNAYVWWTIVRYYGPIGDGTTASNPIDPNESYPAKGEVTKKGFVMSQFSKFIYPGYYRVESSVFPPLGGASVTAYKDPLSSKIVVIAINSGSSEKENIFKFENDSIMATLSTYTTSESKNCEQGDPVNVIEGTFKYTLEPQSITTFVSE